MEKNFDIMKPCYSEQILLQSGTKVVYTVVQNGCFSQTFNSFIISFLLNAVNPLTPRSNVVLSKKRLEGLKFNIDFGGKGLG